MAETVAGQSLELINRTGMFDVIVPFLLGFAITYGMLEKTKIFGEDMQRINMLIAFAVGIAAVLMFN